MKRILYFILLLGAIVPFSCDDETFTTPQVFLDSPSFVATQSADTLSGSDVLTINVTVTDAPAGVDSIAVSTTNDLGSFTVNENGIIGQTEGSFSVNVELPLIYEGKFDITVEVFDRQIDETTGDPVQKSFSQTFSVETEFQFDAPQFAVSFNADTLNAGDTSTFTVDIIEVAGGGIDLIELSASAGTIEYDQDDADALQGESAGVLTGIFTAGGATTTGSVSVTIRDVLQLRSATASESITTICPSDIDISGDYRSIAHGVTRTGVPYNAIEDTVTFTMVNAGQFDVDDRSFGEYVQILERDEDPEGTINVCGDVISPRDGSFFQHSGKVTVDDDDNIIIDIDWVNDAGDTGVVRLYKLE
ncbi:MAG: hypothetical protein AAGG59_03035 [Bacteroidota bacterium]